jgi:hypothetical protein
VLRSSPACRLARAGTRTGGQDPAGRGLIPKGASAYAGTFVVGKAIQRFHGGTVLTRNEREAVYREALDHGRNVAQSFDTRS